MNLSSIIGHIIPILYGIFTGIAFCLLISHPTDPLHENQTEHLAERALHERGKDAWTGGGDDAHDADHHHLHNEEGLEGAPVEFKDGHFHNGERVNINFYRLSTRYLPVCLCMFMICLRSLLSHFIYLFQQLYNSSCCRGQCSHCPALQSINFRLCQ